MRTRRKFLFDCSTAVAGLALIPLSSRATSPSAENRQRMAVTLSYAALAGQLNTLFRVRLTSGQVVNLQLIKAQLLPQTPAKPGRRVPGDAGNEKFSLIFSGPPAPLLESAIHSFDHKQLGRFEMYIGEIGMREATSVRYQAIFNRPAPADSPSTMSA